MLVRLTYINFSPENRDEIKKIYKEEIVPVVRQQKGNLNIMLLEPVNEGDDYISVTHWESNEDAAAYEASGKYRELVEKVKHWYTKKPVLKVFTSEVVGAMSAALN